MLEQFELATLIENDLDEYVSIYLSQPKLSKEEREVLYEKILNGDEEAKNQLLLSYLKYPIIMAKRCAKDIDEFKDEYGFSEEVADALKQLNNEDRDLICFYYGAGYSYREISELMGISPQTLRKRMERIKAKLAEILSKENV